MSFPVMIALTPGSLRARLTSMFKIRACEKGLRTNPPQRLSGRVISAEYRQAPVTLLGPSTRAMLRPMKVSFTSIPRFFSFRGGPRRHTAPLLQSAGITCGSRQSRTRLRSPVNNRTSQSFKFWINHSRGNSLPTPS